jgi:hypothetical protein
MGDKANTSSSSLEGVLPSRNRLILFAVLLPAAVAGSNQWLLTWAPGEWLRLLFYPWMAASTAVLSWCAGKYLSPAWLRWLIFGWCLLLLDCLTIAACVGGDVERHFAYVMVLAQISLIVLWAILATAKWQWRLPVVLAAAAALIVFSAYFGSSWWRRNWSLNWSLLMLVATVVTVVVCIALRLAGFALREPTDTSALNSHHALGANQFGLKHMLIWATALVPILLVLRGADFLVLKRLGGPDIFSLAITAIVLATVNLVAIWAVLGRGHWLLQLATLLVIPYFLAEGLRRYLSYVELAYVTIRGRGPWNTVAFNRAWYDSLVRGIADEKDSLIHFLCINAALLAALLLFLRASGYRLAKAPRELNSR